MLPGVWNGSRIKKKKQKYPIGIILYISEVVEIILAIDYILKYKTKVPCEGEGDW